ncbi:MAG: hypothetical protein QCH35_05825 [Methanomicrobiaceae archaeon]|nr:hypothetical protein [Methanomicrobiaceae archaeon]
MMVKSSIVLLIAATVLFIVLMVPFADSPQLYDVQTAARTSHHTNPQVFGAELTAGSDRIFADMQSLLDANEQIIRYIRAGDYIAAIHEYQKYNGKSQQFSTLVTNLGLDHSEIGTFAHENVENRDVVFDIFIGSIRAEQLRSLENTYEEQGDAAKAAATREERRRTYESLSAKKGELNAVYQSLAAISSQYQLNDESYLASLRAYDAYLTELAFSITGEERGVPEESGPPATGEAGGDETGVVPVLPVASDRVRIYFRMSPENGIYGDEIRITGSLRGPDVASRVINIYLDNQNWATATTTETGAFEAVASVEKMTAGVHAVYCYSGASYSNIQLFSVAPSESVLTLELEEEPLSNNFICRGTLYAADNTPVRNAPVELYVNSARKALLTTGDDGSYETVLTLPTGENTIQSIFQGQFRGYPLDASRSSPISVATGYNVALLQGLLFLAGAGLIFYVAVRLIFPGTMPRLRDATQGPGSREGAPALLPVRPEPAEAPRAISPGVAFDEFLAHSHNNDWLNAIHVLYLSLKETLITKRLVPRRRSMTPREVSRTLQTGRRSDIMPAFMEAYERIYYGRIFPEGREQEMVAASWKSILTSLGDDDHEP